MGSYTRSNGRLGNLSHQETAPKLDLSKNEMISELFYPSTFFFEQNRMCFSIFKMYFWPPLYKTAYISEIEYVIHSYKKKKIMCLQWMFHVD